MRLGKSGEVNFNGSVPEVKPGRWLQILDAHSDPLERRTILSTGATLGIAMEWRNSPAYEQHSVHSLPLWGMASKVEQCAAVDEFHEVVTLEDHLIDGGFGSWMMEAVVGKPGVTSQIKVHALSSVVCGTVGSQNTLNILGGIGSDINIP